MSRSFSRQTMRFLLVATLLFCCVRTLYTYRNLNIRNLDDFYVYDTASSLVAHHGNADLYDGADQGIDPQFLFNAPASAFAQRAFALGIPQVRMYVYPPLLADLLLLLSWMDGHRAGYVWLLLNCVALLLSAGLLARVVEVSPFSRAGAAILAGLLSLFSVALAFESGQITVMLLLLWVYAIYAYREGRVTSSAAAMAIAVCIKLTPLIAVVPFVIWSRADGNWQMAAGICPEPSGASVGHAHYEWLRAFAGLLFTRVMPAISRGIPHLENRSIASGLQILYRALHGGSFVALQATGPGQIPSWLLLLGKVLPLCILTAAAGWTALRARTITVDGQVLTLAAFSLLSVIMSPVSWFHGFVVAYPLLVLLWAQAMRQPWPRWRTVLLMVCSLDLSAALVNGVRQRTGNTVAAALLTLVTPLIVLLMVGLGLSQVGQSLRETSA